MEITSKHLVLSRAASNLPPLKTSVIVLDGADSPDRNIHVGGGGGGAGAAAGGSDGGGGGGGFTSLRLAS